MIGLTLMMEKTINKSKKNPRMSNSETTMKRRKKSDSNVNNHNKRLSLKLQMQNH